MTIYAHDPKRRTNAQAIEDLATLGILRDDDEVFDMTVGPEAGFWKRWRPKWLVTNDTDRQVPADLSEDGTALPMPAGWCDVAVWDPPYANRGTSRHALDDRYGLGEYRTRSEVEALLIDGTKEALRVSRRLVLVKCQDACVSGQYAPQTFLVWEAARWKGATLVAELYVSGSRAQPAGKAQKNVWASDSTLMVWQVAKPRRK